MKLPNGDRAIVDDEKLLSYVLNPEHVQGGPHAYLFKVLLDIDASRADDLRAALLIAARECEATPGRPSRYRSKFEVRFQMDGPRGTYRILSVWIIPRGEDRPRLVTAYVEK